MNVLVVIVNYRTPGLTIDCLKSLAPQVACVPGTQVVVTDNKSPDDSVAQIAIAINDLGIADWCRLMPLEKNGGFAYGNNEAIKTCISAERRATSDENPSASVAHRSSLFDLIWLLNPDTIALPGALIELIEFMKAHPAAGIAGGRAENRDGSVRRSCFRFHSTLGELEDALQFGPAT
ncbi:MAG: glycosyltransferase, partial [Burkholderiales bacterium]|nr:glycosyltransferase [Phycisphaerae bacterium]